MIKNDECNGIFAGDNPFIIFQNWLAEAEKTEINDPNAMALATVDRSGMPNVRIVLLKEIQLEKNGNGAFVFYTNYASTKAKELNHSHKASFVIHWKTLGRQIRVRGEVSDENGPRADDYFMSRSPESRLGAWASHQSSPISSRQKLLDKVEQKRAQLGSSPSRPPFWGGFRIVPYEIEFWANGEFRLHDRLLWSRQSSIVNTWTIVRLSP